MNWIKENIKMAIAIFSFASMIAGFVIGIYVTHLKLSNDIELLEMKVQFMKDNDLYNIRQRLNSAFTINKQEGD